MNKNKNKNKNKNVIDRINKYLKQIDLIDLYITKNICKLIKKKSDYDFISKNIFLLGFVNKNRKNSLRVLLDNSEYFIVRKLIKENPEILNYKSFNEINLFQMIIAIEYFHDLIIDILQKYNYDLVLKIITNKDSNLTNSIDLLISIIIVNENLFIKNINENNKNDENISFIKIKKMLKLINEFNREDLTMVISKLCARISNSMLLLDILKYINPNNIDIYPDKSLLTCIDYLIINENYPVLNYLVPKINFIYFINIENNFLFELIENYFKNDGLEKNKFIKLIFDILSKSNLSKIKNKKNENIFFKILEYFTIDPNLITKYIEHIDIYEKNIDGLNIYKIINDKYGNILKKSNINKKIKYINFSDLLEPTEIGLFSSDILHNMLYTIVILQKYKNLIIPYYFQTKEYNQIQKKYIDMSNNEKYVLSFLKLYFNFFNSWLPYIIIWKNKYNYYLDENLINFILQNKNIDFIYIRLSISLIENLESENIRHANLILIDNKRKIIERFEPYGEINYFNSYDINLMIEDKLAKPIGYEFKFIQSYPGFQTRSDESNKYNKVYGDPFGFCLAWCLLYLETRLILDKSNNLINPIDAINNYIIDKFKKDYHDIQKDNQNNLYMIFIRYYGKKLDSEKNKLLKKMDIEPSILYNVDITSNNYKNIIKKINMELYEIKKRS